MSSRRPWISLAEALSAAAVLATATPAAAGWIAPALDGDARVTELRVAHASSPTRTVVFEQLELTEVRGETAWIVELPDDGWIEPVDPAFFPALEHSSAPVLSPLSSLGCGIALVSTADDLPTTLLRPVVRSLGAVAAREAGDRLSAAGFSPSDVLRKELLSRGTARVGILVLSSSTASGSTVAVRIVSGPRAALSLGASGARLRLFALGSARGSVAGRSEVEPDFAALRWGQGGPDWWSVLSNAKAAAGSGVVATFAARDGIFSGQALGATGTTLPSVVERYVAGRPLADVCATRAGSLSLRSGVVGAPCPRAPGWVGAPPTPSCTAPSPGEIAPSELTCGDADDLAAAFAGQEPAQLWMTRMLSVTGGDASVVSSAAGSLRVFHEVTLPGDPRCGTAGPGPTDPPPTTGPTTPPSEVDPAPPLDARDAEACASVAEACAASSSSDGGCASSDGGGDSCSGPGDSGGAEGCNGAGGSSDSCRLAAHRPRVRVSAVGYLVVAIAALARRAGTRGTRQNRPGRRP